MAEYAHSLNKDTVNNLFTSSRYDSDISKWVNDTAFWHQNDSGVLVPTGSANPMPVEVTGSNVEDITFHDAAIAAADGTIFVVGGYKTLTIEIYGTSSSRTIVFIGRGASGMDRAIIGVNLTNLATATNTTETGELWQFDITGLTSIFMDLQAVEGGNVSIKGRVVS